MLRVVTLALGLVAAAAPTQDRKVYALIDIDRIGPAALASLKEAVAPEWTVEADGELLVLAAPAELARSPRPYRVLDVTPDPGKLFTVREAHDSTLGRLEGDVLVRGGRQVVVQARTPYLETQLAHPAIERFEPGTVLARQAANSEPAPKLAFPRSTRQIVDRIDGQRWFRDVEALTRFNRYTHGNQIADARDALVAAFSEIPGLTVTTETFRVGSTTAYNVVAKFEGTSRPNDWYIVGAHYDATSQSPNSAAPGAEDNASGSAALLEMARALSAQRPAATVWLVAFSGEEQGLHGGKAFAERIVAAGDKDKVKAMLNMDMIGYTSDADLDCLLESDQRGSALWPTLRAAAEQYTRLRIVTSLNPWGSDHVPFIQRGMPALLTIENDWDSYPSYHRTTDTPEKISIPMGEETMKMNLAALWQWAGE